MRPAGFVGSSNKKQTKKKTERNMKIITKTFLCLQMTALFLTAALASAVAAETPFRGSLQAVEIPTIHFPTVSLAGSGAGNASQLGNFTVIYEAEVNLVTFVATGSTEFTAANGDRVFADFVGQSHPTGIPNLISIVETYTITGGTGRFTDATGTFVMERLKNQITGDTSGSFDGTIVNPE
jgi:hypothetical protein